MITLESYLESGARNPDSYALHRALENIKNSCLDVYKLNDIASDCYSTDIFKRLRVTMNFIKKAINLISEQQNPPPTQLRMRKDQCPRDFYDHFSDIMFEIILAAASVKAPPDNCWTIQHNAVRPEFFGLLGKGKAWQFIHFKLRRLLFDEIRELEKFPNFKSSRILGFCLNVMGLKIRTKKGYVRAYYPLHKAVLAWTSKNYLRLKDIQPEVARSCIIDSISFDEHGARLVKTYAKGLELEAHKDYLELVRPSS